MSNFKELLVTKWKSLIMCSVFSSEFSTLQLRGFSNENGYALSQMFSTEGILSLGIANGGTHVAGGAPFPPPHP